MMCLKSDTKLGCSGCRHTVYVICALATISFVSNGVYQYMLDEDVSRIAFKTFNSNENDIYPAVTLCFSQPLLNNKLAEYGTGVNITSYNNFLQGIMWDERMAKIDIDDVSVNFEDYLLGKLMQNHIIIDALFALSSHILML